MKSRSLAMLACVGLLVHEASCATAIVADDAYTSTVKPGTKRGDLPVLAVGVRESSYVRFDLSSLPSLTSNQVAKATLRLWVQRVTHGGSLKVFPVESNWSEATITQPFSPTVGTVEAGSIEFVDKRRKFYVTVDLTALVREWVTGQRVNYGIAVKSATNGAVAQFDSKENAATSHEPTLEIILAGPQGDQGLAGGDGADGEVGMQGLQGIQGIQGIQGNQGETGPQGVAGPKGDKGDQGEIGPDGPSGATAGSGLVIATDAMLPTGYSDTGFRFAEWKIYNSGNGGVAGPQTALLCFQNRLVGAHDGLFREFDLATNQWPVSSIQVASGNGCASATDPNGVLYFCGGYNNTGGFLVANVVTYDLSTGVTGSIPPMPLPGQAGRAIYLNGHLYVSQNNSVGNPNPIYDYNFSTGNWTTFASLPGSATIQQLIVQGTALVAIAGVNELYRCVPGDSWVTFSIPDLGTPIMISLSGTDVLLIGRGNNTADARDGKMVRVNTVTGVVSPEGQLPIILGEYGVGTNVNGEVIVFGQASHKQLVRAALPSFRKLLLKQ